MSGLKPKLSSEKRKNDRPKKRVKELKSNGPDGEPEQEAPGAEATDSGRVVPEEVPEEQQPQDLIKSIIEDRLMPPGGIDVERVLSKEEKQHIMSTIRNQLKPGGKYSENAAGLCQSFIRSGISRKVVGKLIEFTILTLTGVSLKQDLDITFSPETVKALTKKSTTKLDDMSDGTGSTSRGDTTNAAKSSTTRRVSSSRGGRVQRQRNSSTRKGGEAQPGERGEGRGKGKGKATAAPTTPAATMEDGSTGTLFS